jgi:hypothetical protein
LKTAKMSSVDAHHYKCFQRIHCGKSKQFHQVLARLPPTPSAALSLCLHHNKTGTVACGCC